MDVIQRVKADIEYLENWTLGTDIEIILKTYGQVLFPPKSAR
jgi:lipopolysaccharide/colanic/teichoic acid biosynthesis glycosyltransferase